MSPLLILFGKERFSSALFGSVIGSMQIKLTKRFTREKKQSHIHRSLQKNVTPRGIRIWGYYAMLIGEEEEDRGTDGKADAFLEMSVGLRRIDGRDDNVGSVCGCDVDTSHLQ